LLSLFHLILTHLQFQLLLGDYFKIWDYAAEVAEDATSVISWINNHSKVRLIFDEAQEKVSLKNTGEAVILAYLVACLTRWTTHFTAFARLLSMQEALTNAAGWQRLEIIRGQLGVATSTEADRLTADANRHCDILVSAAFWNGLAQITGDIEVFCCATNLAQKDSTRADQILLCLVGVFVRFSEHPEGEVKDGMIQRIEKRWKDCDQHLFLLALVLNPWEKLSRFGDDANLDHFKCVDMAVQVCSFILLFNIPSFPHRCTAALQHTMSGDGTQKSSITLGM
jgi:hypothetical protein